MKHLLLHAEYWISDELGFSLFLLSLKNPLTWAFIIYNVYVLIIMKPAQLFPERRDVPLSRWAERVGGTRVGSLCVVFFWQGSGGDACYSPKCLESVPFPLQSVSFHCSSGNVFALRPEGKGRALWPCESGFQQYEVTKGAAVVLWGTHMGYMCSFKDIAGRAWLLAACYHWQASKKRLPWTGLRTRWLGSDSLTGLLVTRLTNKVNEAPCTGSWEELFQMII